MQDSIHPPVIFCCNIEGNKHLEERILPFLERVKPEVVCLQEVFKVDLNRIKKVLEQSQHVDFQMQFLPIATVSKANIHLPTRGELGIAIFAPKTLDSLSFSKHYYTRYQNKIELPIFFDRSEPNSMHRGIVVTRFEKNEKEYTIATTHFTWSPAGSFSEIQSDHFVELLDVIKKIEPCILCGDFNSPRQGEKHNVYNSLAARYQSWLPPQVTTTIDPQLHKAGKLDLAVDGVFATPEFRCVSFQMVDGISDHQGMLFVAARL